MPLIKELNKVQVVVLEFTPEQLAALAPLKEQIRAMADRGTYGTIVIQPFTVGDKMTPNLAQAFVVPPDVTAEMVTLFENHYDELRDAQPDRIVYRALPSVALR